MVAAQHAAMVGHANARGSLAHPVGCARRRPPEPAVFARTAYAADAIESAIELADDLRDFFRRVLQVGVERDHVASARFLKAGSERRVLTEIASQDDDACRRWTLLELGAQQRQRAIGAAVVDEYDFVP